MNRKQLVEQIFAKKTFLCVGLDTDLTKVPDYQKEEPDQKWAGSQFGNVVLLKNE